MHLTDLSWTESGEKSLRSFKKGEALEVVVLSIDPERERISLGVKQFSTDPFEAFYAEYPKGSEILGVVTEIEAKRIIVKLTDEISGCLKRNEAAGHLNVGDSVETVVSVGERKHFLVLLSLKSEYEDQPMERKEVSTVSERTKMAQPTKTTFGDIIREKLNKNDDTDS